MSESIDADAPRRGLASVAGLFRERPPAAALRRYLDAVWTNEILEPSVLEVVPDGCIDIYWTGERLHVAGPNTHVVTSTVLCAARLTGVRFRPGVGARWLGIPALEIVNTHPALEDILGKPSLEHISEKLALAGNANSAAGLLEQWVWRRMRRAALDDPLARRVVAIATRETALGTTLVRELVAEFGCSERTLRRRCEEAFGYGPKTLERILRFQRFMRRLQASRASLSALATETGYADQAHLAREVRKLAGRSPTGMIKALQTGG